MLTPSDLNQLPSITLQSPLAIMGAFIYLVRDRFAPKWNLNWQWTDDAATTGLWVEAQYNEHTEVRDGRPGVFIDREQTTYGKVSTGHLDQTQPRILQTDLTHYISFGQTDISIDCLSTQRGESMMLGDTVQSYIESSKYVIMKVFGFRDISPLMMGKTQAFAKQVDLHQTSISFRVEYETRWATTPVAPILRGLQTSLQETKQGVNSALAEIYLKSTQR